jgi:hypothetical protein
MTRKRWDAETLEGFQEAAQSLKLYRRADLQDVEQGTSLIEELYVDPLPEEQVLRTVLRANTTFVIGRKGTGKSTIFQRLQSELRKSKVQTSAYIDIKTIYESSQVDHALLEKLAPSGIAMSADSLHQLLLYREFLKAVISAIKDELQKRIKNSLWERIKEAVSGGYAELFEGLDEIIEDASAAKFISVLAVDRKDVSAEDRVASSASSTGNLEGTIGESPGIKAGISSSDNTEVSTNRSTKYSDILIRTFDIKGLLKQLKSLLDKLGIRHLHVLVDDFSELPEEAMQIVVDVLLAPLNNWSEEFIKFKVAAYPGRIYYGKIDKTKIDEVYLDLYRLHGTSDVLSMEESAIDFTRRLVSRRLEYYCKCSPEDFFEGEMDEIWRQLFYATMANPRNLGYILHYLHEAKLIYGSPIGLKVIQDVAQKYYEEKIEPYFTLGKFLHETFAERSSIFSLKELLEAIVVRAKGLRSHDSAMMKKIKGRRPTSHFHVLVSYEGLLSTLELNFFLTKYYEMSDRDGRKVTVFALNYGLCSKYTISFGRPKGEREFRLYFVERIFDYTPILRSYMAENQEIVCELCGERYSFENLEALRFYDMRCKKCPAGVVKVTNLSKKYAKELESVRDELLLPPTELGILQTLHTEATPLRPGHIAAELDCSYQLVGKRGKFLAERGLVKRFENPSGQRLIEITEVAEKSYFPEGGAEQLDVPVDSELVIEN